ncbi:MAG: hypothetical protein K0S29_1318 [Gammaproteobacteria bacterium]|jgi:hypothetical protein|nr:hypothetical protein [Gammaproteobacteria bacterium]
MHAIKHEFMLVGNSKGHFSYSLKDLFLESIEPSYPGFSQTIGQNKRVCAYTIKPSNSPILTTVHDIAGQERYKDIGFGKLANRMKAFLLLIDADSDVVSQIDFWANCLTEAHFFIALAKHPDSELSHAETNEKAMAMQDFIKSNYPLVNSYTQVIDLINREAVLSALEYMSSYVSPQREFKAKARACSSIMAESSSESGGSASASSLSASAAAPKTSLVIAPALSNMPDPGIEMVSIKRN